MEEESRFLASATLIFAFDVHADYREENKRFQTTESSRLCVIGNDGCNLPPPFSSRARARALAQIDWRSEKNAVISEKKRHYRRGRNVECALHALGLFAGAETPSPRERERERVGRGSLSLSLSLSLAQRETIIKIDVAMAISGIAGY